MVKVIVIRSGQDIQKAVNTLKGIRTQIPLMSSDILMRWGQTLERNVKQSAKEAGIKNHTGELLTKGIQWRQRPKGRVGELFIRDYGVKLDSMKPHYVNITRNRSRFLSWGLQAKSGAIRRGARNVAAGKRRSYGVYVRPHPFIRAGYLRTRKNLLPMIKQKTRRMLQNV